MWIDTYREGDANIHTDRVGEGEREMRERKRGE